MRRLLTAATLTVFLLTLTACEKRVEEARVPVTPISAAA